MYNKLRQEFEENGLRNFDLEGWSANVENVFQGNFDETFKAKYQEFFKAIDTRNAAFARTLDYFANLESGKVYTVGLFGMPFVDAKESIDLAHQELSKEEKEQFTEFVGALYKSYG